MKKIILDLCGGTGAWSKPYKDAGYEVIVITLPDYNVLDWRMNGEIVVPIESGEVYGILAAPPCTEFSRAKGNLPRDFETAMKVVQACMAIIWKTRINSKGNFKFWALENPVGFLRQFLGIPKFTFWQWQYGAPWNKQTDLWGYFNSPKPFVFEQPDLLKTTIGHKTHAVNYATPNSPEEYKHLKLDRAAIRSITPAGFAKAFYEANK